MPWDLSRGKKETAGGGDRASCPAWPSCHFSLGSKVHAVGQRPILQTLRVRKRIRVPARVVMGTARHG